MKRTETACLIVAKMLQLKSCTHINGHYLVDTYCMSGIFLTTARVKHIHSIHKDAKQHKVQL